MRDIESGPTVRKEIQDRVLLMTVGGTWSLFADRPSWTGPEETGVRSVRVVPEGLRTRDPSLLLFLLEVPAWSRELEAEFYTASLPGALEDLFMKLVSTDPQRGRVRTIRGRRNVSASRRPCDGLQPGRFRAVQEDRGEEIREHHEEQRS